MIVGLGQDRVWGMATPIQTDVDFVLAEYAKHGQIYDPSFHWVQRHASHITSGAETREQTAASFARYFDPEAVAARKATAEGTTVAEAAGVPSVTDIANGVQMPTGVTDFLTGEMIAGVPNWLLLGGVAVGAMMMMGKR